MAVLYLLLGSGTGLVAAPADVPASDPEPDAEPQPIRATEEDPDRV
jgi:hypothetical protein